ncbi:hypothetical protein [Sinorhizobium fredii]|uniref:hypothetical protein n=1 Tax=Rhizobium fredii TaxID=380 RepID=UPI0005956B7C|nr:hypothetical protein [Sinorhizobium fredii]WOS62038.1 hypothetical protein SFGR64A_13935 [Sinorhizobium fredii GR64]
MTSGTQADRIIELLRERAGLDDDEIAKALGIEPRQTVNQICRRLAASGVLRRERGNNGKIVNVLDAAGRVLPSGAAPPVRPQARGVELASGYSLVPADLARTLLIIPCSGAKRNHVDSDTAADAITQSLPGDLARELLTERSRAARRAQLDESTLIPAWQRYDGSLYQAGREAIGGLMQAGAHVVILSGGYGAVLAREPIGDYEAVLDPSLWPDRIIERVLLAYATRHRITSVRAIVSATGPYVRILQRWREADIADALLLTPQPEPGGMRRSPASQGEALAALRDGVLTTDWRSSYGLALDVRPI